MVSLISPTARTTAAWSEHRRSRWCASARLIISPARCSFAAENRSAVHTAAFDESRLRRRTTGWWSSASGNA